VTVRPGDVVADRYSVERRIASGGMSDVFEARDLRLDRAVALKAFRSSRETDLDRFAREVRLLARLRHPNLVQLYDGGSHDGVPFAVLELVDGPTLAERLRAGPLTPDDVRAIGRDVAGALAYVHAHGVVHRDVKPSNVLLDRSGRALLGDFGIAQVAGDARLTSTSTAIGTGLYMAPEQLAGERVTPAADVYALGLVLVETLTAQPPFGGTLQEAALARFARAPEIPAAAGPELAGLLAEMTARDPAGRPSARSVAGALDVETTAGSPVGAPADLAPTQRVAVAAGAPTAVMPRSAARAPARRRRGGAALVVVLLVLLAAFGVAAARRGDGEGPTFLGPAVTDAPFATTATGAPDTTAPASPATTAPPDTEPATTSPPTTTPATEAPPPADCADLEARKAEIDEEEDVLEERYADDKRMLDAVRRELDAELRAIDRAMKQLDC
jgi:hypothetical protein